MASGEIRLKAARYGGFEVRCPACGSIPGYYVGLEIRAAVRFWCKTCKTSVMLTKHYGLTGLGPYRLVMVAASERGTEGPGHKRARRAVAYQLCPKPNTFPNMSCEVRKD